MNGVRISCLEGGYLVRAGDAVIHVYFNGGRWTVVGGSATIHRFKCHKDTFDGALHLIHQLQQRGANDV